MNEEKLAEYERLADYMAGNVVTILANLKRKLGGWTQSEETLDLDDVAMAIGELVEEVRRLQVAIANQTIKSWIEEGRAMRANGQDIFTEFAAWEKEHNHEQ